MHRRIFAGAVFAGGHLIKEFIIEGTCFGTKVRSITSYTKSARVANSRGKNQYM